MASNTIDRLKAQLLKSSLQVKDQVLFQIINQLIDAVSVVTDATSGSSSSSSGGVLAQSFGTVDNEQATLANSKQLYPGQGIQFNNQGQKLIISGAYPLPDYESPEYDANIPLPGPQGLTGLPGPAGVPSPLTIPLPYEYDISEIETLLLGIDGSIGQDFIPIDIAYAAGNFTASGAMTWGVDAGDQITYAYTTLGKVKKLMVFAYYIQLTTVGGVLNNELRIALPSGYTLKSNFVAPAFAIPNAPTSAIHETVLVFGGTGNAFISIFRLGAINWLASVNNCSTWGTLIFGVN